MQSVSFRTIILKHVKISLNAKPVELIDNICKNINILLLKHILSSLILIELIKSKSTFSSLKLNEQIMFVCFSYYFSNGI